MRQREKEMHNIRVKLIVFLQVQNGKLEKLSQNQCKNKPMCQKNPTHARYLDQHFLYSYFSDII